MAEKTEVVICNDGSCLWIGRAGQLVWNEELGAHTCPACDGMGVVLTPEGSSYHQLAVKLGGHRHPPVELGQTNVRRTYLDRCLDVNCAHSRPYQGCQYVNLNITRTGHCGNRIFKTED